MTQHVSVREDDLNVINVLVWISRPVIGVYMWCFSGLRGMRPSLMRRVNRS